MISMSAPHKTSYVAMAYSPARFKISNSNC